MDSALISAFRHLQSEYRCSVDSILIIPEYREEFLARVRVAAQEESESAILGRLLALRKRSVLPTLKQVTG